MEKKKTFLVIGHARHGKDTVSEILCKNLNLTFVSSSLILAEEVIYPKLKDLYGYKSVEECFNDRSNHRKEWFTLLKEYNTPDKARLGRLILSKHDLYCGLRNIEEFYALKEINAFNYIIWVDASERKPLEPITSMTITKEHADIIIDNNKTLLDLKCNIYQFMYAITKSKKIYLKLLSLIWLRKIRNLITPIILNHIKR